MQILLSKFSALLVLSAVCWVNTCHCIMTTVVMCHWLHCLSQVYTITN